MTLRSNPIRFANWRSGGGGGGGGGGEKGQVQKLYNTTVLPNVNIIALGMFYGAKYTHHTHASHKTTLNYNNSKHWGKKIIYKTQEILPTSKLPIAGFITSNYLLTRSTS